MKQGTKSEALTDALTDAVAQIGDDPRLSALLASVQQMTGMGFVAIAYVSGDRWICSQVEDDIAFGLAPGDELEVRKTICDEVRQYGSEIIIDDTRADPDWWNHPVPLLYGFRSYLSVPLIVDGKFFGTLCAIDPAPRDRPLAEVSAAVKAIAEKSAQLLVQRLGERPDLAAAMPMTDR